MRKTRSVLTATLLMGISSHAFAAGIATGDPSQDQYDSLIIAAAEKYGHPDPGYLKAQIKLESAFDVNAVSPDTPCGGSGQDAHSLGLFQVTPQCGEGGGKDLFDPAVNIDEGAKSIAAGYKHFKETYPGCTERQYVEMAAAGWVQDWETITGCGEYQDSRQNEYVSTVSGYYEEWYGGSKPVATSDGATLPSDTSAASDGEKPLPVEPNGGNGETPSEGPTVAQDASSEGPGVTNDSSSKDAGNSSSGSTCKSDVFQPPVGQSRERLTAFFLRRDVLEAKFSDNGDLPAKCVKAKPSADDGADEKVKPARSAGTKEINSKCKDGTKPEEDAFKAAAVTDAGLSEEDAAALDLSCKADKPTVIDIPKDTNASFAEEFSGAAGNVPGGVWYFFDAWGGGDWRDAIYDKNHAKLDGNGNLVLTGEPGSDGKLHTSYLQTYNQANQDAPSPAKFGPGTYIEARIDMSGCGEVGSASWCAFWLFDPSDPYDGNPENGTEIDILEYTRGNEWSAERFTSSSHTINGEEHNGAWHEGANPSDGFHVYGLDWQPGSLKFYFDDKLVWETTKGVSGSDNQAVILSIENQKNLWAPNTTTNSSVKMVVDYVRAYDGGKP